MHACNFLMGGASLVFAFLLAFKFGQISLSGPWDQKIESAKVAVNHVTCKPLHTTLLGPAHGPCTMPMNGQENYINPIYI